MFCPIAQAPLHCANLSSLSGGSAQLSGSLSPVQHYVEKHHVDPPGLYKKSNLKKTPSAFKFGAESLPHQPIQKCLRWSDPIAAIHEIPSRQSSTYQVDELTFPQSGLSTVSAPSLSLLEAPAIPVPTSATAGAVDNDNRIWNTSTTLVKSSQELPALWIPLDMNQVQEPRSIAAVNLRNVTSAFSQSSGSAAQSTSRFPFHHPLSVQPKILPEVGREDSNAQRHHKRRERPSDTNDGRHHPSKVPKLDINAESLPSRRTPTPSPPPTSGPEDSDSDSDGSLFSDASITTSDYDNGDYEPETDRRVVLGGLSPGFHNRAPTPTSKEDRFCNAIEQKHNEERRRDRKRKLHFVPRAREITANKLQLVKWSAELVRFHYLMVNDKFKDSEHGAQLMECLETVDRFKADPLITPAVLLESKIAQNMKVFRHAPYERPVKEVADRICRAWRVLCQEGARK